MKFRQKHIISGTVIGIILLQGLIAFVIYKSFPDWTSRGQFGDVFGAVNALFSGLAFAGLIYAILLQREDLALQRKELELTRIELQRSALAQEQSEIALKDQAMSSVKSAKLATINFLLSHYKAEIHNSRHLSFLSTDPRAVRAQLLKQREIVLLEMLDNLFDEVSKERNL